MVPRRVAILSRRIPAKFQSIGAGQLGIQLSQIVEAWLLEGQTPPALVLLRTIVNYYDTGSAPGVLFNILDLQKLAVHNGNLEGFINSWYMVLRGMNDKVDPKILEHLFFEAIKDHKDLSEDIAYYKRKEESSDHVDRSLRFLEDSVNRCVRVAREEKNRRALSQTLVGGSRPAMPGPSASQPVSMKLSLNPVLRF